MLGILSRGIARIPHLSPLLGDEVHQVRNPYFSRAGACSAIAGWGRRPSTKKSRAFAMRHKLPFIALEDGFLRSCGLGVHGAPPLSLVMDDLNIYYDAGQPSRLESLISSLVMDEELHAKASRALELIRLHGLSKYNHAPALRLPAPAYAGQGRVLVVDQTAGDVSVTLGGSTASAFRDLLDAALNENADAQIWIKTHPDVVSGKKQGYFGKGLHHPRVRVLAEDISPLSLLEQVDKVYVVTSQMGFEALMLRKPVVCFGQPWYAGWGLTDDRHPDMAAMKSRRNVQRSLEELFTAAYLQYARYIEPATGAPGTIFDVIDWLARNKEANDATRGELWCVGMSMWKRAIVRPFLESPSTRVRFVRSVKQLARQALSSDAKIVIWGIRNEETVRKLAAARKLPIWRMEDGFLRSVGLGSDLHRPVSLVLDRGGMYYDPASGSELETMLATQALSEDDLQRAARFRQAFVSMRVSKYNIGGKPFSLASKGRRVLLVPGQVDDDASIKRGSPVITGNLALLRKVREENPDAYIVYKPHPDVVAGNRDGGLDALVLNGLADQCVVDANIIDCILAADEVHTMTSLSGFEALLHGRVVHCYGGPFYAGWGLTIDHFPLPHRQRRVSLDELVFAAMLKYPRYAMPGVQGLASAEQVLSRLVKQAARPVDPLHQAGLRGWLARKVRKATAIAELLRGARGASSAGNG
jgi:capsular polysaccharide export protein